MHTYPKNIDPKKFLLQTENILYLFRKIDFLCLLEKTNLLPKEKFLILSWKTNFWSWKKNSLYFLEKIDDACPKKLNFLNKSSALWLLGKKQFSKQWLSYNCLKHIVFFCFFFLLNDLNNFPELFLTIFSLWIFTHFYICQRNL